MYKSEIVEILQTELIKHPVVNSTNYGSEFDVNINGNDTYPMVFIETEASSVSIDENMNVHNMALYFLDKHTEDVKSTILDKQRLMEQVMYEFCAWLDTDAISGLTIGETRSGLSLFEFESDILAGWRLEIEVRTNNPIDRCDLRSIFSGEAVYDENTYTAGSFDADRYYDNTDDCTVTATTEGTFVNRLSLRTNQDEPLSKCQNDDNLITIADWIDFVEKYRAFSFQKNVSFKRNTVTATDEGTLSLDLDQGNFWVIDWQGSTILDFTNPKVGTYQLVINNQTPASVITLTSGKFQGTEAPTLTASAGAVDIITATYDGSKMIIVQTPNIIDL